MPDPFDNNDDWAELARELDRNKPPTPPPLPTPAPHADMVERQIEAEEVEPHHGDARVEDEVVTEGEAEAAADEDFDDAEEVTPSEAEANAEGQPGTGRKRRRRRRRRRKGGAPEGAALADGVAEESENATEEEPMSEAAESDDFGSEDAETEIVPFGAEEDTANEILRDLIANWNVPSWDDIVGGLYRPGS